MTKKIQVLELPKHAIKDGNLMQISRDVTRIDGPCIASGADLSRQHEVGNLLLRRNIFVWIWLLIAIATVIGHRYVFEAVFDRRISLAQSNVVVLPFLVTIILCFDAPKIAFPLSREARSPKPTLGDYLPEPIAMRVFGLLMIFPALLAIFAMKVLPTAIGEGLLMSSTVAMACIILFTIGKAMLNGKLRQNAMKLVKADRGYVWLSGVAPQILESLPSRQES